VIHVTDIIPPVGTPPDDWPSFSWFAVWDQLVGSPCDLAVGGEVILIDERGRATWRTEVTDLALVPFEHVTAGLEELERRWRIRPRWSGPDVSPGMLVAWRARPLGYLDIDGPDSLPSPLVCADCGGEGVAQWLRTLPSQHPGPSS
jgi:hypothetical protein